MPRNTKPKLVSYLVFQPGQLQVVVDTVEEVGTAVAEMSKVKGHLRAFTSILFILMHL